MVSITKVQNDKKKIIIAFFVITILFTLFRSSMSGVLSLFYKESGISVNQISEIKSWQNWGILIGIIPAGILADKFGRLKILLNSGLLIILSFSLLLLSSSNINYSIAEFFYGLGLAINSGVLMSYIADYQEIKGVRLSGKEYGRRTTLMNFSSFVGGGIGTTLFTFDKFYPIYFSIIGMLIYVIVLIWGLRWLGVEDNKGHKKKHRTNFFIKLDSKNSWFLFANIIFESSIQVLLIYWSIYFVDQLKFNLSIVFLLSMLFVMIGSELHIQLLRFMSERRLYFGAVLFLSGSMMGIGIVRVSYIQLSLFMLFELVMGLLSSQMLQMQNNALMGNNQKSSVSALVSFITELVVILSMVAMGQLLTTISLEKLFIITGIFISTMIIVPINKIGAKNGIH